MHFCSQSCAHFKYISRVIASSVIRFLYTIFNCSGESMENALRACCKGIKIGKILIHRVGDNGQQVTFRSHDTLFLIKL